MCWDIVLAHHVTKQMHRKSSDEEFSDSSAADSRVRRFRQGASCNGSVYVWSYLRHIWTGGPQCDQSGYTNNGLRLRVFRTFWQCDLLGSRNNYLRNVTFG